MKTVTITRSISPVHSLSGCPDLSTSYDISPLSPFTRIPSPFPNTRIVLLSDASLVPSECFDHSLDSALICGSASSTCASLSQIDRCQSLTCACKQLLSTAAAGATPAKHNAARLVNPIWKTIHATGNGKGVSVVGQTGKHKVHPLHNSSRRLVY
jgi:hypothetical protein